MSKFYALPANNTFGNPQVIFVGKYDYDGIVWWVYPALFPLQEVADIGASRVEKNYRDRNPLHAFYMLILYVYMTESVSYVVALRQNSVIFAVLLGGYLLKESQTKLRFAAAVVMVIGVFLIFDSVKQDFSCAMFHTAFPDLSLHLPSRIWLRFPPIVRQSH